MDLINALSKSFDVADVAWEINCREEDLKHRAVENERRYVDDARRAVNEKAEQLKAVSGLSALVAGFAMVRASLTYCVSSCHDICHVIRFLHILNVMITM